MLPSPLVCTVNIKIVIFKKYSIDKYNFINNDGNCLLYKKLFRNSCLSLCS